MAVVRITEIPQNRRDALVEMEVPVRGFRGATAVIARDLRHSADNEWRNKVMRLWAKAGRSGGFAYRNGSTDAWVLFEYEENTK